MGLDIIKNRAPSKNFSHLSMIGPGKLSKLMGIHHSIDEIQLKNMDCNKDGIWIEDLDYSKSLKEYIEIGPRIGIDYAEEDALLPYRFNIPLKNKTAIEILEKIRKPIHN